VHLLKNSSALQIWTTLHITSLRAKLRALHPTIEEPEDITHLKKKCFTFLSSEVTLLF